MQVTYDRCLQWGLSCGTESGTCCLHGVGGVSVRTEGLVPGELENCLAWENPPHFVCQKCGEERNKFSFPDDVNAILAGTTELNSYFFLPVRIFVFGWIN